QLLLIFRGGSNPSGRLESLANALETARRLISMGNSQANLTAARAHLMNFIAGVQQLLAKGDLSAGSAAALLRGARDILEQIEGNQPVRPPLNPEEPGTNNS